MSMFRAMQNPDTPNLPFAQRPNPRDNTTCYEIFGTEMQLTNEAAQYYRNIGQTLKPCSSTPPPTSSGNGWTKSQIENIIEEYHGDDVKLLHDHAVNFGTSLKDAQSHRLKLEDDVALLHSHAVNFGKVQTKAKIHRDSIESKVEKNISAFSDIHTKLSNLGKSVSDVSAGLSSHSHNGGGNGCDCDFLDIPCQMGCGIEKIIPYILIGGVALLALRKK